MGEKLKESTEDVGDRLLLALKYPESIAGSETTWSYDLSRRDSQSKSNEVSWSWNGEQWETSIATVAVVVGVGAGKAGRDNEEDQGGCSIYLVGGVSLHLRLPPLASRSSRNKTDT